MLRPFIVKVSVLGYFPLSVLTISKLSKYHINKPFYFDNHKDMSNGPCMSPSIFNVYLSIDHMCNKYPAISYKLSAVGSIIMSPVSNIIYVIHAVKLCVQCVQCTACAFMCISTCTEYLKVLTR